MESLYSVLGVILECDQPLPHLEAGSPPAAPGSQSKSASSTLKVKLGHVPDALVESGDWQPYFDSPGVNEHGERLLRIARRPADGALRLRYLDGTEFYLDGVVQRVWVRWREPATLEDATTYLLGPTLGLVLRLRGVTLLHASAIVIDGRAIAIAGPAGAGKSTTAAAFAQRGHPVLTDDIVALEFSGEDCLVQADCSLLRLWPESSELLGGSAETLPRLALGWEKRFLDVEKHGYRAARRPYPLAAVYILDSEPAAAGPEVRELTTREGVIALVANAYANLFADSQMRGRELDVLARLVRRLPVCRVHKPAAGLDPAALCELIGGDFRRRSAAASA